MGTRTDIYAAGGRALDGGKTEEQWMISFLPSFDDSHIRIVFVNFGYDTLYQPKYMIRLSFKTDEASKFAFSMLDAAVVSGRNEGVAATLSEASFVSALTPGSEPVLIDANGKPLCEIDPAHAVRLTVQPTACDCVCLCLDYGVDARVRQGEVVSVEFTLSLVHAAMIGHAVLAAAGGVHFERGA